MFKLSTLIAKLPAIQQARMVATGYGVWLTWAGKLAPSVPQTLSDHGALLLAEEPGQAIWFDFSEECLKALARLQVWARLHALPVLVQVIPATLLVGYRLELAISSPLDTDKSEAKPSDQFEVWVNTRIKDKFPGMPGLELKAASGQPFVGAGGGETWEQLQADPSMTFAPSLGWYFVMKPVGNPQDRTTSDGWRRLLHESQHIYERLGLKYITSDSSLILSVDSLRQYRGWLKAYLQLVLHLKEEGKSYWPSVLVGVRKNGLQFSDDLLKRINVAWKELIPDFPHVNYRSGLIADKEFTLNEARFSAGHSSVDDWCYLSLAQEQGEAERGLEIYGPMSLQAGTNPCCFYCGLRGHKPAQCPSRVLREHNAGIWEKLGYLGMADLSKANKALDAKLGGSLDGLPGLLAGESAEGLVVKGVMEVGAWAQLRSLELVWRSNGKDLPGGIRQLGPPEGELIWEALELLRDSNHIAAEKLLGQALVRYPRSYQPRSLMGFLALEIEDGSKALFSFKEAERLSFTPLQQAYCAFLQGRAHEFLEDYDRATALYKQAQAICPRWLEASYRQAVCMVKIGFTDQALMLFIDLIAIDPSFFNRILMDTELERGRIHIMAGLGGIWRKSKALAAEHAEKLEKISKDMQQWFPEDDEFLQEGHARLEQLMQLKEIENFAAFDKLTSGVITLGQDMSKRVETQVKELNEKVGVYFQELREIYKEASWFPFRKLLRDFNRDFNGCVDRLNFMRLQSMHVADNFRRSKRYLKEVEDKTAKLRGRLVSLKIIRDATLFLLLLGRTFMWFELLGLGLSLLIIPTLMYLSQTMHDAWWADLVMRQKWQLQQGVMVIISVVALGLASLKTAIGFEKKKEALLRKQER